MMEDSKKYTKADAEALKNHQKVLEQSDSCPDCDGPLENVAVDFWRPILSCMDPDCRMHISDEEVRFACSVFNDQIYESAWEGVLDNEDSDIDIKSAAETSLKNQYDLTQNDETCEICGSEISTIEFYFWKGLQKDQEYDFRRRSELVYTCTQTDCDRNLTQKEGIVVARAKDEDRITDLDISREYVSD